MMDKWQEEAARLLPCTKYCELDGEHNIRCPVRHRPAVAAALAEANHCKYCCCAQSWNALGVTEYTGKSIIEHIEELRAEVARLRKGITTMDEINRLEKILNSEDDKPVTINPDGSITEGTPYRKQVDEIRAEVARLNNKFPCGHRIIDWDDSYGGCAFCIIQQQAFDYDKLPHEVIECHDKIEQLEAERDAAEVQGLEIAKEMIFAAAKGMKPWSYRLTRLCEDIAAEIAKRTNSKARDRSEA
jgi:hypothetical protein